MRQGEILWKRIRRPMLLTSRIHRQGERGRDTRLPRYLKGRTIVKRWTKLRAPLARPLMCSSLSLGLRRAMGEVLKRQTNQKTTQSRRMVLILGNQNTSKPCLILETQAIVWRGSLEGKDLISCTMSSRKAEHVGNLDVIQLR